MREVDGVLVGSYECPVDPKHMLTYVIDLGDGRIKLGKTNKIQATFKRIKKRNPRARALRLLAHDHLVALRARLAPMRIDYQRDVFTLTDNVYHELNDYRRDDPYFVAPKLRV